MKIIQALRLAMKGIRTNKMRSFLTMLGLIIGVASVIILVSLMNGVSNFIVSSFSDMGTNMLTVSITNTGTRTVTDEDMYDIALENSDIFEGVTPKVTGSFSIKKGNTSLTRKTVTGVGENYNVINHINVANGRFIGFGDIQTRNRVCVIGTYYCEELFETTDVIGETIKINGDGYTIVGVLEEQDDSTENSSDDCIYIPYTVAARANYQSEATTFIFAAHNTDIVERAETLLDNTFYEIYKDESLYTITSMTQLMDTVDEMTGLISTILSGIAAISLLVAGIGIMNIMLVSVVERTREIGVRKALGAKKSDILWQFVIEAATISTLGGIIGIILGTVVSSILGNLFGVQAIPSSGSVLLSFGVSAGIGIFFGFMPAKRAAKLNPIDALRNE